MDDRQDDSVAILMALYDAGPHLAPQLDSLRAQSCTAWHLIVSDDGARDGSAAGVAAFAAGLPAGKVRLIPGPGRGFARNFLHLIAAAGPRVRHAALSDHDDVWLPQKLERALAALAAQPADLPVLYCARTLLCRADLTVIGPSPVWPRPFGFRNALVQNVAAGNTIVLNRAALDLAQAAAPAAVAAGIAAHDWWLYQIVTGAGGRVIRDNEPVLLYRQHPGNEMGRNDTTRAALVRLRRILAGTFRDWNGRNIAALRGAGHLLTPDSRAALEAFAAARDAPGPLARLHGLAACGAWRQTRKGALGLWLAALLGRL